MLQTGSARRSSARKYVLGVAVVLALPVFGVSAAAAEPVQQFSVQLKDLTPDGRYSVVYTSNAFDTTGDPPPALDEAVLRLAKGMTIKPEFLRPDRLCDTAKFAGYLYQNVPKGGSYAQVLDDFPRGSARIERRVTAVARETVATCRRTFLGRGTAVVDGRPRYPAPIPAKFSIFLTKPTAKGAIAGIGVLSHYDRSSPIAVNELRYTVLQPTFTLNIFDDPTPDGQYGYRVRLLTERTSGFRFSIAELRVESRGIVGPTEKRTCAALRGGRCVRYRTRRSTGFWATPPRCPASGEVPFKAEFRYVTGLEVSTVVKVPCPKFRR